MGFRIGEVLDLNSGDIDLAHHLINVNKTLTKLADGTIVMSDSPKTKAGNRILPIPKVLEPFIALVAYVCLRLCVEKCGISNSFNILFKDQLKVLILA